MALGILSLSMCSSLLIISSLLYIYTHTTCFELIGHLQVYDLFCTLCLYKVTATSAGYFILYCAAMHVFSFYDFWKMNLLSFQCMAVMYMSVLLNLIHYAWWLAIVFHK
jgi:hypothetical protein